MTPRSAYALELLTPLHATTDSRAHRQTRPRWPRSGGEGRCGRAARRGDGGHLHRPASDAGNDRDRGGAGGCRRRRPVHSQRRTHDTLSARAGAARGNGARRRAAHWWRHHPARGHRGAPAKGRRQAVRSRHADHRSDRLHQGVVRVEGGSLLRADARVTSRLRALSDDTRELEARLRLGGGSDKIERQHSQGKLTARERITALCDPGAHSIEIGLLVAYDQYDGQAPGAGVVIVVGMVSGREVVIVANDATVKAGSWWPETIRKILRAQEIAMRCRIPIIYLVDSAGVNLPYQGGVFPGQYGASRIFYYNSIMRRYLHVPQIAAVMGPCIAGGAYLPALSDVILMVENTSFMGLGGPNLVKGATGQVVDGESLGGARTHTEISAVAHYKVPDDAACCAKIRELIDRLPRHTAALRGPVNPQSAISNPHALYELLSNDHRMSYDMHAVLRVIADDGALDEIQEALAREMIY